MSHILIDCWLSDRFLRFFEEFVLLLFILYDDLCIFDADRPLQCLLLLLEPYDNMVNLLAHHTEIKMVALLLQLLHFFYGNGVILVLLSYSAIDIDILVIRVDNGLIVLYFLALVEGQSQSSQIDLYFQRFYLFFAGLASQQLTLYCFLLLLHIQKLISQLFVSSFEAVKHKLTGVDMFIRFVHGLLEASYGCGCVCGVVEGKGIVERGDVLFHVSESQ